MSKAREKVWIGLLVIGIIFFNLFSIHLEVNAESISEGEDQLDFENYIEEDEKYLEEKEEAMDIETLKNEVEFLNGELDKLKDDYIITKSGAMMYHPVVIGSIHVLSVGKRNRLNMIYSKTKGKEFKYDSSGYFSPLGEFDLDISGLIPKEVRNFNYEQTKLVLDNIEIDIKQTDNIVFVVSPYSIKGINGYSYTDGSEGRHDMAVINNYRPGQNYKSENRMIRVRGTVLHELGHLFHNSQEAKALGLKSYKDDGSDIDFWKDYNKLYDGMTKKDDPNYEWKNSRAENLAEDFRMYYSNRLGKYSFKPAKKKTVFEYNTKVTKLFDDYSKIGKSTTNKSFASVKVSSDERYVTSIDPSSKLRYTTTNENESMKIEIDTSNSHFKKYMIYGWDANDNLVRTSSVDGAKKIEEFKITEDDKEIDVITVAVVHRQKQAQKWRIDVVR